MKNKQLKYHFYMLITLFILIVFFIFPMLISVFQSLGYFPSLGLYDFTFKYYIEVLTSVDFLRSLKFTLFFSFTSSLFSVIIGVFFGFVFYKNDNRGKFSEYIVRMPILVPHIIATLIIYLLFSQSGIISRIFYHLNLINEISDFFILTQDNLGLGIILAYMWKGIPFVLTTILAVLKSTNSKLSYAAQNLGASNLHTFFKVILPVALPNIITSFIILFAFSFGAFEIPYLLGPTYPKALPTLAYQFYTGNELTDRVYAMVINVIITVFCLVLLHIYIRFDKKRKRYNMDSHLPSNTRTVFGKNLAIFICVCIILSFIPLFLWAFSKRWQWPLLLPESYSARAIAHLFTGNSQIVSSVLYSIAMSFCVTFFTVLITLFAARTLARKGFTKKRFWYALIFAPIMIPSTSIGMGLYSLMLNIGLQNSFLGVMIANIIPCIPYAMLILQSPCELLGNRYEKQALMLGEKPVKLFFNITLPILSPVIKAASIMVFMVSFGQYFLTFLIGGGLVKTMPIIMFPYIQQNDRVLASAYSIIYIAVILVIIRIIEKSFKNIHHHI